ncbi:MAG TPA: sulfite exporter TauE/SafE family protein, partial [Chloroflexota bacterium]|nr:sulfite exporter TauE/SafE family protein [Chloroflexota bacterium]
GGAAAALYFAAALLGRVAPPDRLLAGAARRWGGAMRAAAARKASLYESGLVWGMLPCGLVLAALLTAGAAASPLEGALAMLAFGVGTLPAHVALAAAGHRLSASAAAWPRRAAALVTGAFGTQLALRGLAALGTVGHFALGPVALW